MFQNITTDYTLADASGEIFIMLLWAFLLGILLGWVLKPRKYITQKVVSAAELKGTSYTKNKKWTTKSVMTSSTASAIWVSNDATARVADDLKLIEWVGPKLEKLLNKHGVSTFKDVVDTDVPGLEDIILAGGPRFQVHSPTTWPDQARLAMQEKWKELEEYQSILNGGRER